MNTNLISTPDHFISSLDGKLITSSLLVAEAFGKQHAHVIRSIENLDIPENFTSIHFWRHVQKISIGNGAQRDSKIYRMTKDGFMLLVMGFTGKRAMAVKIAYINAFNRMAIKLKQQEEAHHQLSADLNCPDNQQLLTDANYRTKALSYIDGILQDCHDFAKDHGMNTDKWHWESSPVDYELAASGLLADILSRVKCELTFNEKLQPQITLLPPGSFQVDPNNESAMVALAERVVNRQTLVAMIGAGVKRLASQ